MPTSNKSITPAIVARLRKDAKKLKKQKRLEGNHDFGHKRALDVMAHLEGFPSWEAIKQAGELHMQLDTLERNKEFLIQKGFEFSIFEPTQTGLNKSILDATHLVRSHFSLEGFHDYEAQGQGKEHRVRRDYFFALEDQLILSTLSLYRPVTKNGDPRMWFKDLPLFAKAGDQIAIIITDGHPNLFNLSQCNLIDSFAKNDGIGKRLQRYLDSKNEVSDELLVKLKKLALQPIPALGSGDTAIGMAIEAALGIPANSSKKPDYKGIELKAGRGSKNRSTLFAQVSDWALSACKSSREIVEKYGYEREGELRLYCTISTQRANSQGLRFEYDGMTDRLYEKHVNGSVINDVAAWTGQVLRERLQEKHAETFWIQADSIMIDGVEHFQLKSVVHTRSPILTQLMPLIESGIITMDHLIKKKSDGTAKVTEKGPLFKIDKHNLHFLFPEPITYTLS